MEATWIYIPNGQNFSLDMDMDTVSELFNDCRGSPKPPYGERSRLLRSTLEPPANNNHVTTTIEPPFFQNTYVFNVGLPKLVHFGFYTFLLLDIYFLNP